MTSQLCSGFMALDLRGMPEDVRAQVRRTLEEATSAPAAPYVCVVVGVVFGLWIVDGPFFGRSPGHARMEAVESFISFGAARFVGPFPVASLRGGVVGTSRPAQPGVALGRDFG